MNGAFMTMPRKIAITMLLGLCLGFSSFAIAETPGDPIVQLDTSAKMELDLSLMIDEMMPLLLSAMAEEDEESAMMLDMFQELLGLEALQTLKMESKSTKDSAKSKMVVTLDPEMHDTLLFQFLNAENGKCGFSRYVNTDDLVMFMTVHNFPAYLTTLLDFIARPELADFTGDLPVNENGDLALGDFAPRTDLLPLLAGELDIFILDPPNEAPISPLQAPVVLVLGSTDGFALKALILELAAMMGGDGGAGIAEMVNAVEIEQVGKFEFQELPMGGALAVSEDYLVLSFLPEKLREMLTARKGDLKVPDGLEWVYLNGPKYGAYMDSIMEMAGAMGSTEDAETEWMMKFYDILFDHIEYEEILYRSIKNGIEITADVEGPVHTGMYRVVYRLLEELPALMEQERMKGEHDSELEDCRAAIGVLDEAMTMYSLDNDGHYPDDPMQLVDQGYLSFFPLAEATPAGEYLAGGYTYHPQYDDSGMVVGYMLFAYAMGEGTGFDVYTPENLTADGNFTIGRDGMPDGVATYCYDGTAIAQIEAYNGR